jgi:GT2 family glycosyltransferase
MSAREKNESIPGPPLLSVIVLNYNGAAWLTRCVESLLAQTIVDQIEVIIADNASSDSSPDLARRFADSSRAVSFADNGSNLGFCAGNNAPARGAKGDYLLFLNNDTWLEPDCLERLMDSIKSTGAAGGAPLILNYSDDSVQSLGAAGFDICGFYSSHTGPARSTYELMAWSGCSYLIRKDVFFKVGMFDDQFFMYADEWDLSWRLWIAGHKGVVVPAAKLHHRSEANVNSAGGEQLSEFKTSVTKRYYANRNNLLTVLKNAQHVLLVLAVFQIVYLFVESVLWSLLSWNSKLFTTGYLKAMADCWKLRSHVFAQRRQIAKFRVRSDWWMLRFFRIRLNRWDEIGKIFKKGLPKVSTG